MDLAALQKDVRVTVIILEMAKVFLQVAYGPFPSRKGGVCVGCECCSTTEQKPVWVNNAPDTPLSHLRLIKHPSQTSVQSPNDIALSRVLSALV